MSYFWDPIPNYITAFGSNSSSRKLNFCLKKKDQKFLPSKTK